MRLVIQRVSAAQVSDGSQCRDIGPGLVVLFGAGTGEDKKLTGKLAQKTAALRIFDDSDGKMNLSASDLGLDILVVPNFTLYADTSRGLRPSFIGAADPDIACRLYEDYLAALQGIDTLNSVQGGFFGQTMSLDIHAEGPVTIIVDTKDWKRSS